MTFEVGDKVELKVKSIYCEYDGKRDEFSHCFEKGCKGVVTGIILPNGLIEVHMEGYKRPLVMPLEEFV